MAGADRLPVLSSLESPYLDERQLLHPAQPEMRDYRLQFYGGRPRGRIHRRGHGDGVAVRQGPAPVRQYPASGFPRLTVPVL